MLFWIGLLVGFICVVSVGIANVYLASKVEKGDKRYASEEARKKFKRNVAIVGFILAFISLTLMNLDIIL